MCRHPFGVRVLSRARLRSRGAILGSLTLALGLLAPGTAQAEDDAAPPRLSKDYRLVARLSVSVPEISGWAALPTDVGTGTRSFLAVSDEGRFDPSDRTVRGALHVLAFRAGAGDAVSLGRAHGVTLRLGVHIPRLDPAWATGRSMLDLEACVPLPGTSDLYLLAGERNPEDISDGGANRLYVVRYPGRGDEDVPSSEHADLLAYLRLPDLADDAINDRLEAVVATGTSDPDVWRVFAFKERTETPGRPPVYFPLILDRDGDGGGAFSLSSPLLDRHCPALPALLAGRNELGAQSDACLGPEGRAWILDRWRREIHLARIAAPPALELRVGATLDLFDLIREVPGEEGSDEPAAPGGRHAGYGRHEALTFDAHGWLWLAADLGGGRESVVTILAPRIEGRENEGCRRDQDE